MVDQRRPGGKPIASPSCARVGRRRQGACAACAQLLAAKAVFTRFLGAAANIAGPLRRR